MKFNLLLFITIFTPLLLFLSVLRFGAVTQTDMKKAVAVSGAYQQTSERFNKRDQNTATDDPVTDTIMAQVFTPAFLQKKTESTIDTTSDWMTGKTQKPPVLSLKELKDTLQQQHPELLDALSYIPTAADFLKAHLNPDEQAQFTEQARQVNNFINTDFALPLTQKLASYRRVFLLLQFIIPVVALLILGSYFLLFKIAGNTSAGFRWVGAAMLTSSLLGLLLCLIYPYGMTYLAGSDLIRQSIFLSLFSPIVVAVTSYILGVYALYQGMLSSFFIVLATIFFLMSKSARFQTGAAAKPVYEGKSYWETPMEEKKKVAHTEQPKVAEEPAS